MFDNFFRSITDLTKIDFSGFASRVVAVAKSIDILSNPLIILDVAIAIVIVFFVLIFLKKIRLLNLIWGAIVLIILYLVARFLNLTLILFIIKYFSLFLIVVLPFFVVPSLRGALNRIEADISGLHLKDMPRRKREEVIEEIARAVKVMAGKRVDSLTVLENKNDLKEYIKSGKKIEAKVSAEFLINIFFETSTFNSGATIIRGDEIVAGKCILPKTKRRLHLEHSSVFDFSAMGLSEITDAIVVVTSSRRGDISIAHEGNYVCEIEPERVGPIISNLLAGKEIGKKIDISK